MEKQAGKFVEELWTLLVDAQQQPSGIPSVFIERKKEEILSRQQKHAGIDSDVIAKLNNRIIGESSIERIGNIVLPLAQIQETNINSLSASITIQERGETEVQKNEDVREKKELLNEVSRKEDNYLDRKHGDANSDKHEKERRDNRERRHKRSTHDSSGDEESKRTKDKRDDHQDDDVESDEYRRHRKHESKRKESREHRKRRSSRDHDESREDDKKRKDDAEYRKRNGDETDDSEVKTNKKKKKKTNNRWYDDRAHRHSRKDSSSSRLRSR